MSFFNKSVPAAAVPSAGERLGVLVAEIRELDADLSDAVRAEAEYRAAHPELRILLTAVGAFLPNDPTGRLLRSAN
jgi:hypothetical protein